MNTEALIAALSADAEMPSPPIARTVWLAVCLGAIAAVALFFTAMPLRPDIAAVIMTPRFLFKWVLSLALLASALVLTLQLARPQLPRGTQLLLLLAAPALLAVGVVAELMTHSPATWMRLLVGTNAIFCMLAIPLLSALPLAALIVALRQGAPSRPALAGATAGLAAAGIGATLYAAHCMDDSPLFMATWYVIGTLVVTAAGAYFGARLLRW